MNESIVREQLRQLLDWNDAHANLDSAVADIPFDLRGTRIPDNPHSIWDLLEHIRIAQRDILDFCRGEDYRELVWPGDYWPPSAVSPAQNAWSECIRGIEEDRAALQAMALDPGVDLSAKLPHGTGQTYLRCIVLAADHTAYHVGQIIQLRRQLGIWPVAESREDS